GIMGWSRTWLDMTTAAITAMGVSIGADFAIYLIFRIREEGKGGTPLDTAIRASLHTSGKAILFVSSAVALGYMVLPFSGFSIWTRLGVLTALIVSVSALATLTVLPSLAVLVKPRFLARATAPAGPALHAQPVAMAETG
ncbi:MAG TPA: MMPL family transporter, partial [Albitalea sp.]|nr:MMPL family transporter [Albitalea sp.]